MRQVVPFATDQEYVCVTYLKFFFQYQLNHCVSEIDQHVLPRFEVSLCIERLQQIMITLVQPLCW